MPWIRPEHKETRERVSLKLDARVLRQLEEYAGFVDSAQSYVVTEILRDVFQRDKDFQTWRTTHVASGAQPYAENGAESYARPGADTRTNTTTRRRRRSTPAAATPADPDVRTDTHE